MRRQLGVIKGAMNMRQPRAVCLVIGLVILTASPAFAQGTITGIVRDASGQVLPGVTVEAASPVLIEKVRTALSDGSGQYRIVDLRAGTYTVTRSHHSTPASRRIRFPSQAGVTLRLPDPLSERFGHHTQLRRDRRQHRLFWSVRLAMLFDHPDRALAHLGRKSTRTSHRPRFPN